MKPGILTTILRWLAVVLILRVLFSIVLNYPDYFPPNFDALFLLGRETTFTAEYQVAFYIHIFASPFVLVSGLLLLNDHLRRRHAAVHRWLGRIHVGILLLLVLPSSVAMSRHAFGGWPAGLSFVVLSATTAACTIVGVVYALRRRYAEHRRWMCRSYVLICSAVALRLISGATELVGAANAEAAYVAAAWLSWIGPLVGWEIVERLPARWSMGYRNAEVE